MTELVGRKLECIFVPAVVSGRAAFRLSVTVYRPEFPLRQAVVTIERMAIRACRYILINRELLATMTSIQ